MNDALLYWMARQLEQTLDGEPCSAFRLAHVAAGDRPVLLDRFVLGTPDEAFSHLYIVAQGHAEAFAGLPQRYAMHACYGTKETPKVSYAFRVCAAGDALALASTGRATESPTHDGLLAMIMRHQEIVMHTKMGETSSAVQALKDHNETLKSENEELRTQNRKLRSDIDDLEDRKMERELRALELVTEGERPEREARLKALRFKPVTDMLGPMIAPSLQAFMHAKMNGGDIPPEMHPTLMQFGAAYAQVQKVLTEKDAEAMIAALPVQKRTHVVLLFKMLEDAAKMYEKLRKQSAEKKDSENAEPTNDAKGEHEPPQDDASA
jgi:chaperonin cofactor prefoldin